MDPDTVVIPALGPDMGIMRVTNLEVVPIMRFLVSWGLYWDPPAWGNYQIISLS